MADDAASQVEKAVTFALIAEAQPFRQFWQVAENGGRIVCVVHSMLLPVPPIYAGADGTPGLILPDSFAVTDAPEGTVEALVEAAQAVQREAGARIFLSSFVAGPDWRAAFDAKSYEPLTLYFSRSDLGDAGRPSDVRPANEADVPGIVARSAEIRSVLFGIDPFWAIHPEADARFDAWTRRSLTLPDRDMLVMVDPEGLEGYVIAQPASRLHFPPAHNITGTGVIDDFYHPDLADPNALANAGVGSMALLRAAEAAFAERGTGAAFVVCPAG
ncbi:hypothetical protein RM543_15970 [Roseicyclus sp. F158]|uniref:GNAT family N-acetyltransferase n=1 Tax=Tropicimonas omnivorans TaxID=3075590 RepID=A0ABU3DKF9_9RHOB|nr:hypothetical protein [Roseicyclus sp. F158]MDT0684182.1 hypothetical protein [Roseicyclus sp. F158]